MTESKLYSMPELPFWMSEMVAMEIAHRTGETDLPYNILRTYLAIRMRNRPISNLDRQNVERARQEIRELAEEAHKRKGIESQVENLVTTFDNLKEDLGKIYHVIEPSETRRTK